MRRLTIVLMLLAMASPAFALNLVPLYGKKYWVDSDSIKKETDRIRFHLYLGLEDPPKADNFFDESVTCDTGTLYEYTYVNWKEMVAAATGPKPHHVDPVQGWAEDMVGMTEERKAIAAYVCPKA